MGYRHSFAKKENMEILKRTLIFHFSWTLFTFYTIGQNQSYPLFLFGSNMKSSFHRSPPQQSPLHKVLAQWILASRPELHSTSIRLHSTNSLCFIEDINSFGKENAATSVNLIKRKICWTIMLLHPQHIGCILAIKKDIFLDCVEYMSVTKFFFLFACLELHYILLHNSSSPEWL